MFMNHVTSDSSSEGNVTMAGFKLIFIYGCGTRIWYLDFGLEFGTGIWESGLEFVTGKTRSSSSGNGRYFDLIIRNFIP